MHQSLIVKKEQEEKLQVKSAVIDKSFVRHFQYMNLYGVFAGFFIFISFSLTGCGGKKPGSYSDSPRLEFECSLADALGCDAANAGKTVFIGLHQNLSLNCESYLSLQNEDPWAELFDYSTTTISVARGGLLTGMATHWVNPSLMPVISLPQQSFKVCAFIDLNGNQQADFNEPMHESTFTVGASFEPLSSWSNF